MTINELFTMIDYNVTKVNSIIRDIITPSRDYVNVYLSSARSYHNVVYDHISRYEFTEYYKALFYSAVNITDLLQTLELQHHNSLLSIKSKIETSFVSYYTNIINQLKYVSCILINEIIDTEVYLDNRITKVENIVTNILNGTEFVTQSQLEEIKSDILLQVDEKIATASLATDAITEEINTTIEDTTTSIYGAVTEWVSEIWNKITPFFDWVENEFRAYYNAVHRWIADKAAEIWERVMKSMGDVYDFITTEITFISGRISKVRTDLYALLSNMEQTISSWVQIGIDEINALLAKLSVLTDWRFQFLNVFISRPELSFLEMLTRDEVLFNKYKPYWQALFVRIMSEDRTDE